MTEKELRKRIAKNLSVVEDRVSAIAETAQSMCGYNKEERAIAAENIALMCYMLQESLKREGIWGSPLELKKTEVEYDNFE